MTDAGFWERIRATEPNKARQMPTEELFDYEQYFAQQLSSFGVDASEQSKRQQCQARMDLLRAVIELRSLTAQSERQRQEAFGLGTKTLFWAKMAVLAAIVVPVALALISQFPFSKLRPARIDKASPPTYRQTPASTAALPVPEASSNTAAPSPAQTVTARPTLESEDSKPSPQ